jgi:hypothetical protein
MSKPKSTAKKTAAKKPDTTGDKGNPEGATQAPTEPESPRRLVVVEITPEGKFNCSPVGVDSLAVPTILRLAAKDVEGKFGI